MEWRAPAFQRTQTPRPAEKKQPQRWEDKGFAAARFVPVNGGDGEEEIIEIIDEEQIRREVAEQLELAQADEQRDLLEPTDEEKYGIDNFDAGALTKTDDRRPPIFRSARSAVFNNFKTQT